MSKLRTAADEQARYDAVHAQIAEHMLAAITDNNPVTGILRAQLVAEMIDRNETAHERYQARAGLLGALEWRIAQQMQADADQERKAAPSEGVEAFIDWLKQDRIAADHIKFGDPWAARARHKEAQP